MMDYVRLSEGLNKYELIPASENIWERIKTNDKDYYVSIFKYNQSHYDQWKKTKTISGIKDVTTNKLVFDFDNADNPDAAREDAISLITKLLSDGLPKESLQVSFSGSKGYCVEIETDKVFTPDEFKNVTASLAGDLKTFDKVVSDPNRIIRVIGTKHPNSGLYKFPLSIDQLSELSVTTVKELAASIDNIDKDIVDGWCVTGLPDSIYNLRLAKAKEVKNVTEIHDLDLSLKPKWLTDAKYALQQGYFGSGERNTAFMILGATYKNQGFPKDIVYRMLKGVAEIQANRNDIDRYSDKELYNNVVEVIFKNGWKGGTYSYENTPLLQDVTTRLGLNPPKEEDKPFIEVASVNDIFRKFALDIDKNTIKLGIDAIDNEVRITTSMLVGLLAAPSAGKTSVSLGVLNALSKSNLKSLFFSLDMGAPLVFQRLFQRHSGMGSKKLFESYKTSAKDIGEIEKRVAEEYKNVRFSFKSGVTVDDIRKAILQQQEFDNGERAKLVVIDYLECIAGPYSDATANTALIAQQLKDVANELEVCILLLLQPQKHAGDPSSELLSMRNVKGSSVVEQAASIIMTMWRPGFSPKNPEEDKYLTMAVVKNRMGQLATFDFSWNGITGDICDLDEIEREALSELRKRKAAEKASIDI